MKPLAITLESSYDQGSGVINLHPPIYPPRRPVNLKPNGSLECVTGDSIILLTLLTHAATLNADDSFFRERIAPVFQQKCLRCHNDSRKSGKLSMETEAAFRKGGRHGAIIVAGKPGKSLLIEEVTPVNGMAEMPQNAPALSKKEIADLNKWISEGGAWPKDLRLKEVTVADTKWWSLSPLSRPKLPTLTDAEKKWARNPIDLFIRARHREKGLAPSPEADRRTLIRRLYYDLIGLPPSPEAVTKFVNSTDPHAYEKLVDKLLASPRYGERWARHWLDIVHYADTHGYDKDKPRPNAWPYRDYVIRAFNEDRPYARFVKEQIAGDALYPSTRDGTVALGFLAAGPWDFIGHVEVPDSKIDGKVARNLDRDDMVQVTMSTFNSLTVGCARCHDHKFDPITQESYYGMQAVFAALDRTDKGYDRDPEVAAARHRLTEQQKKLAHQTAELEKRIAASRTPEIMALDKKIARLTQLMQSSPGKARSPAYGYHSQVARSADAVKWVQVDLGRTVPIDTVIIAGADEYGFADFGFPQRFRVEISEDASFKTSKVLLDQTDHDYPRPGAAFIKVPAKGAQGRYVRITGTKLWDRRMRGQRGRGDWIFAIGELAVISKGAFVKPVDVQSLDSIEALPRWSRRNLIDGIFGRASLAARTGTTKPAEQIATLMAASDHDKLKELMEQREALLLKNAGKDLIDKRVSLAAELAKVKTDLSKLPPQSRAYVATVHKGSGNFRGREGLGPRPIHLLTRGEVTKPDKLVQPGALPIIAGVSTRFELPKDHGESDRRVALAEWLTRKDNPLTWRSIVNRIWLYHFGHGIVDSPNDFGRMGQKPSHPQLLDWLAVEFRDGGQSMKSLHRLIVTSQTYRQTSNSATFTKVDGGNQYLWRMNSRRLDAESIRDTVLLVSGRLSTKMGGPGFRDFVIEKPEHSPHYQYHKHNPDDPVTHRRAVYRFLVRSQQEPFMETLDCADPSQMVPKRHSSLTALQALTLLNNKFMLRMAEHFAERLQKEEPTLSRQIVRAYRLAVGRSPTDTEQQALEAYAKEHGLANLCRLVLNLNEFVFVD